MNRWASRHPEEAEEIAALPLPEQNGAMRSAIGCFDAPCQRCGGSGEIHWLRNPPDPQSEDWATCPACHGEGVL